MPKYRRDAVVSPDETQEQGGEEREVLFEQVRTY
jgi:hypothetical protein